MIVISSSGVDQVLQGLRLQAAPEDSYNDDPLARRPQSALSKAQPED